MLVFTPGDTEDRIQRTAERIVCLVQILCGRVESSGAVEMILQSEGSPFLASSSQSSCARLHIKKVGTRDTGPLFHTSRREHSVHCSVGRAILGRLLFGCVFLAEALWCYFKADGRSKDVHFTMP